MQIRSFVIQSFFVVSALKICKIFKLFKPNHHAENKITSVMNINLDQRKYLRKIEVKFVVLSYIRSFLSFQ